MNQISAFATLKLFARTAVRRMLNRSGEMRFSHWIKKTSPKKRGNVSQGSGASDPLNPVAVDGSDEQTRLGTRHRSHRLSLFSRLVAMWLPLSALGGMIMLCLFTMLSFLDSIRLSEARQAPVLQVSSETFEAIQKAGEQSNEEEKNKALDQALSSSFSSPAAWLSEAGKTLAKERYQQNGVAAFERLPDNSDWSGTMSYLSPAGRIQAMQAAGLYLALLNLAVFCTAFGLMSKQLSTGDPNLVWLWQFPVSRRVLFSSKLIENLFDNPTAPVTAVFYATALWIYGASFGVGLGLGTLLGMASAVTAAALRLAVETFLAQRLRRASRGAIVAFVAGLGSIVMLAIMLGDNSQLVVESYLSLISRLPSWIYWNPFTAGLGTDAMLIHQTGWWLVAPLTAMVVAWLSIEFAVHLTKDGLACAVDTVRGHQSEQRIERSHNNPYGAVVWKTMLQMRRQPEQLAQVFGTPMMIVVMLYFTGYKNVIDLATNGAPNISVAILAGVAYMLMMAAVQMMRSEAKGLWLLQCQPRPLADIVRTNARIWGVISIVISIPFVAWAVTMRPTETMTILIRVPYLLASLWLLAEVIFGLTALATNVNNEQNITFNRGGMLIPALIISDVSLAIHSQSWWAQLCTLAMMLIFNAAVRQRALVELPWLSEPIAAPPRFVYPMHGLLVVIGFESVMGLLSGLLKQGPGLTNHQITALAYIGGAVAAAAACGYWMYRSQIPFPEVTRRAVAARPLLSALALCCAAGLITIHLMKWLKIDLFAQTLNDTSNISGGSNDKWYLFGMLVIAAPVFEEWAFRGLIYRCLRRHWNVTLSVATTTVLFVTLHPITSAPALVVLGTATALTAERTGRLWPSMLIHAGYNLMVWSLWFA